MTSETQRLLAALAIAAYWVWLAPVRGDDRLPPQEAFDRLAYPVLSEHCARCHGGGKNAKAGLDLGSVAGVLHGGQSGPVVVPGKSAQSLLVQAVQPRGKPHMPPKSQLSPEEIATLVKWIDGLAPTSTGPVISDRDREHWSFRQLAVVRPPTVKDTGWVRTPVDAFLLSRLESEGLRPSPEAGRAELLRRLHFDLVGLPPTPEEVRAFLTDDSADAYERRVERLLSSPQYGERWGRHWLDLARYADSGGFHNDIDRPNAWRYRDWVIQAFNDDLPYPQFIRAQLAGDEIAPGDPLVLAATGFCRNGPTNEDNMGKEQEKHRLDELDDVISTTSAVFLGLTVGCARCHDHKYDPIPQRDYYRFLAVFNSTLKREVPLRDGRLDLEAPPLAKGKDVGPAVMAMLENGPKPRPTHLLWRGDVGNPGPEVEPGVPEVLAARPVSFPIPDAAARSTGRRRKLAEWIAAADNPLTWRVWANRVWQHHFGRGLVATPSNFGRTGARPSHPELLDYLAGQLIASGGRVKPLHRLIVLSAAYRQAATHRTDAAAVDPDGALIWRWTPRRLEAEALRDSVLAVSGTLNPTAGGPGIKPRIRPDLLPASQRNKWPVVAKEGPAHWRRSVYVYAKRQLLLPLLELLDAPTTTQTCAERSESVAPTQALLMMNDDFIHDQAGHLAARVGREAGESPAAQAERMLWLALARPPRPERLADAFAFLEKQQTAHRDVGLAAGPAEREALVDLAHVLFNCNEFLYVE